MPVPCHTQLRDSLRSKHRRTGSFQSLQVAGGICLLLVALCALASNASAMGPRVIVEETPAVTTPPNEISIQPSSAFDWTAASVGAGFTVVLILLVGGGTLLFSRRRAHRRIAAGIRY